MSKRALHIALVGNPNSGKSTVFNALTGMNQKVANFPGVTVDKKIGTTTFIAEGGKKISAEIIDLPGIYSLYPKSIDEEIPFRILCDPNNELHPDAVIIVADGTNLKRNLFLCSQVIDLKIPVVLVINMADMMRDKGLQVDFNAVSQKLGVPVIKMNARKGEGLDELKKAIMGPLAVPQHDFLDIRSFAPEVVDGIRAAIHTTSNYDAFLAANNLHIITDFEMQKVKKDRIKTLCEEFRFDSRQMQARETLERYKKISLLMNDTVTQTSALRKSYTNAIDNVLTHRFFGYLIFLAILFVIFQFIFAFASYPMDLIDKGFALLNSKVKNVLPAGLLNDLLVNGILAGLNGIVVFIPQIALLFFFIAILEDTGYMARASFIMDKLMRRFGLNGKSVIPLMSGVACAVPAIMSTRTIQNWKERIITIFVTPLMSCSARLPVYTLLIALIIPSRYYYGINLQGLVLMLMYLIGFVAAIGSAYVLKKIIRAKERSYFMMELPLYRVPRWSTIGLHIIEKVKVFLFDAGKVIISISIILWVLSSFAPGNSFQAIEEKYRQPIYASIPAEDLEKKIQSEKLESSYAGIRGRVIEPAIKPIGFDWKIGIALITSFAAREVFVGTMSTIYSVGDEGKTQHTLKEKMQHEINPDTGLPRYTLAVGLSLMLFYAFAMQCMSTVAVVYRETKGSRWPIIQFIYMFALAYCSSLLIYQLLKP
ncbi:ferrous iron transport protein B [soil metagenome]